MSMEGFATAQDLFGNPPPRAKAAHDGSGKWSSKVPVSLNTLDCFGLQLVSHKETQHVSHCKVIQPCFAGWFSRRNYFISRLRTNCTFCCQVGWLSNHSTLILSISRRVNGLCKTSGTLVLGVKRNTEPCDCPREKASMSDAIGVHKGKPQETGSSPISALEALY